MVQWTVDTSTFASSPETLSSVLVHLPGMILASVIALSATFLCHLPNMPDLCYGYHYVEAKIFPDCRCQGAGSGEHDPTVNSSHSYSQQDDDDCQKKSANSPKSEKQNK
ncbi:hypothetical protein OESDEN_12908 [Oesophagostomum dentatum]|uniref:Uncharacterized protein n=1 Tax=Oesophagostomum dentatum TaxID=61180 RepID=A0A0B1SQS9_OESDE|nr:hypothetical protein OESDEN_12908 [Oesophagostomum dentatum]